MLDRGGNVTVEGDMHRCKEHLNLLQIDEELNSNHVEVIAPKCPTALQESILALKNPMATLRRMHELIGGLCDQLERVCSDFSITIL